MLSKIHIIDDSAPILRMASPGIAMAGIEGKERSPVTEPHEGGAFDLVLSDVGSCLEGPFASTMTLELPDADR